MDDAQSRLDSRPGTRVSATDPDWSREQPRTFWDPGRKLIKTLRDYVRLGDARDPITRMRRGLIVWRHRFWSAATSCDIPLGVNPGGGFVMPHPYCIVIHPRAVIGPNCLFMHQTTLGTAFGDKAAPVVGGHVDIGAGAKIIGGVTIGDHVRIGANAVVLCDVPAGATAVGVPARVIGPRR
jgi:serine O-acetyltransferase